MRIHKATLASIAALSAVLFLGGCASEPVSAIGTWGGTGEGEPQLVLEKDGILTGTDGCNRLMGSWAEADKKITFTGVASTMMFCEGVDTWLVGLDTAVIDGKTLKVSDASGAEIGTLERAAG